MSDSTKNLNTDLQADTNEVVDLVATPAAPSDNKVKMVKYQPIMTGQLIARIDLHGQLILQTADGQSLDAKATIQLLNAEKHLQREIAIVWVPTQQTLMTQVMVPGKRKAHWLAALPYAMEETLSSSVDEYHILPLNRDSQGLVSAIAVNLESMQAWQDLLQEYGLEHAVLVADCFRLPFTNEAKTSSIDNKANHSENDELDSLVSNETWFTCTNPYQPKNTNSEQELNTNSGFSLVRTLVYQGFAADENWMQVLKAQYAQSTNSAAITEHQVAKNELLSSSQASLFNVKKLSLSQGQFNPATKNQTSWYEWSWVGVLSVLIVAVWMAMQMIQTQQIEEQARYTQAQTEKLFKTLFPETKRIVNIKSQTLTKLRQSGSSQSSAADLMPLLQGLEPLFAKPAKVKLIDLNWNPSKSNALTLQVQAPASADLEKLMSQAKKNLPDFKMRLNLKNVTSELAEGVIYVNAN